MNHEVHLVCDTCDDFELEFKCTQVDDLDMLETELGDDCLTCGDGTIRRVEEVEN